VTSRRPVQSGLFDLADDGSIRLVGGWSPSSGHHHFPRQPVCPYSGADDVEEVRLSGRGRLWAWTAVTTPPAGYSGLVPYGFGVVELDEERLRVVGRITESDPDQLDDGMAMRLVPEVLGEDDDGTEIMTWAFAPEESS